MPYRSDEREKFFREDFPAVCDMAERVACLPEGNVCDMLSHSAVDSSLRKLSECIYITTRIIRDDLAEIESLKAIIKGMGK
jgi:hypothetical protein